MAVLRFGYCSSSKIPQVLSRMDQIEICHYKSKMGELILGSYQEQLCLLDFRYRKMRQTVDARIRQALNAEFVVGENDILASTKIQLDEYLTGGRKQFDLPMLMVGSEFQKSVWRALVQVPYGATSTYLELARAIGNEKAVRAVANANGANAIAFIIPCHRIIGSNGQLIGYGGGLSAKKRLLNLERENNCSGQGTSTEQPQLRLNF